jgi:S-adenosylmethionine hydrolase
MGTITLISDFGAYYPAIMKAAILEIAPDATIIDVTHEIRCTLRLSTLLSARTDVVSS